MHHSPDFFGISNELYEIMFGEEALKKDSLQDDNRPDNIEYYSVNVDFDPDSLSRTFAEESVDEIR